MRALAACMKPAYTGAMRTARKIRHRLEWLGLKFATKFVPLLSRKACYRLALLLGSLGALLDRRGPRGALGKPRGALCGKILSQSRGPGVGGSHYHFVPPILQVFF